MFAVGEQFEIIGVGRENRFVRGSRKRYEMGINYIGRTRLGKQFANASTVSEAVDNFNRLVHLLIGEWTRISLGLINELVVSRSDFLWSYLTDRTDVR